MPHRLRERDGGPEAHLTDETQPRPADVRGPLPRHAFFDCDDREAVVDAVIAKPACLGQDRCGSVKIDAARREDAARRAAPENRRGVMVMLSRMTARSNPLFQRWTDRPSLANLPSAKHFARSVRTITWE